MWCAQPEIAKYTPAVKLSANVIILGIIVTIWGLNYIELISSSLTGFGIVAYIWIGNWNEVPLLMLLLEGLGNTWYNIFCISEAW